MYIELNERVSADSQEVALGVVLDFDEQGTLVSIDTDNASRDFQFEEVVISGLQVRVLVSQSG